MTKIIRRNKKSIDDLITMKKVAVTGKEKKNNETWGFGRATVAMLIILSFTDLVIIHLADAHMDTLTEPDHYDFSPDVIRPAFQYQSTPGGKNKNKNSNTNEVGKKKGLGLGRIISMKRTAVNPILPSTNQPDGQQEKYYSDGGLLASFSSALESVRDVFTGPVEQPSAACFICSAPRGGSSATKSRRTTKKGKQTSDHALAMSTTEPFVPLADIEKLTLRDVSMAFRFGIESTRNDFNRRRFISDLLPGTRKIIEKISSTASKVRDDDIPLPVTGVSKKAGDIDALHFCAAMRIFAEWRLLRQVPEGYSRYAMSMSLGQKDIVQNVAKIEQAVHTYIDYFENKAAESEGQSHQVNVHRPTLRDLLQFEYDMDVHDNTRLPHLKDKTAAVGLLWVRRQLHYQTALFSNLMKVPTRFNSAKDAVMAAYNEVYNDYHGWAIQKIFNYGFQAAPDAIEVYRVMNPTKLREVEESLEDGTLMAVNSCDGGESMSEAQMESHHHRDHHQSRRTNGLRISKVAGAVGHLIFRRPSRHHHDHQHHDHETEPTQQLLALHQGSSPVAVTVAVPATAATATATAVAAPITVTRNKSDIIDKEMERDAYNNIESYLAMARPVLDDLAKLFNEFNMNDPGKV